MISQGQDSRVESAWEDKEHLDPQQLWRAVRASLSSGMKIWIAGSCIFLWSKQNLWWHSATPKQVLGWSTAFFPVKPLVYCTAHSVLRKWVTLFQILFPLCSYIQAKINQNYEQLLPFIIQSWRRPDVFAASRFTLEMNPSLRPSWQGAGPQRLISPSTIRWIPLSPAANHPPKMPPRAGKLATVAHEMQGASKRSRRVEVSRCRSTDLCHLNRGLGTFNLLACHQFQPSQQLPEKLDVHRMVNMIWMCGAKGAVTLCYAGIGTGFNTFWPLDTLKIFANLLWRDRVETSDALFCSSGQMFDSQDMTSQTWETEHYLRQTLDENETSGVWEWCLLLRWGMFRCWTAALQQWVYIPVAVDGKILFWTQVLLIFQHINMSIFICVSAGIV